MPKRLVVQKGGLGTEKVVCLRNLGFTKKGISQKEDQRRLCT